ncbi:MAG: aspartate aminotransferase family protein [Spirochaetaceae bacterium]|jgi:4-aminobutyrate aminotransferase-like enzyme|nr:aspartate aminotransferase family protein [Spirochaetaceae bacterium]
MMERQEALELRREYFMPCVQYFYKDPPLFVRGDMQYLYDERGKKYLDFFAGVSVMNCGHSNPFITERVAAQLGRLQHLTNVYLTEPVLRLAARLAQVLPGGPASALSGAASRERPGLSNSFFCNSGSEANEGALLLARLVTGKRKFIALNTGLHGRTYLAMAVTGIPMWRTDPFLPGDFYFAGSAEEVIAALEKDGDIAALICEPVQGNGGVRPLPPDFFEKTAGALKSRGALLIVDEVQTGFARTGRMFAVEHYGVIPDIMTMSKALGNGIPIAAFASSRELALRFTRPSASTLGGNPVSASAALAVLDYIEKEDLCARAGELGAYLRSRLDSLASLFPVIREVRGKGLMLGAEIAPDRNSPAGDDAPGAALTDRILEELKERGIILGKNGLGRNVLAFQPPLVINRGDIDFLIENLEEVLRRIL